MLVEAYSEHALGKSQCFEWFKKFKSGDFDMRNEERGKPPKSLKTANCKHCWMRMTLKLNNNSRINWMSHEKSPLYIWNPWERSRRWENGFHMNWMKDSRKTEKPLAKCCSPDTKESHFSIELWLAMKSGWYFENHKRKRSWVILGEPSTSIASPNRYGRKTMLCVWWDQKGVIYYELLKPDEIVNTEHYR